MSAQLDFTLSLIDKITRPLKQAEAGVKGFAGASRQAFANVAVGGAGLLGVGMGIKAVLQPAHEMNMALGEVRSLGTAENALNALRDAAMNFSIEYGGSAADFVKSSYDIQSAISGLAGNDLAAFTNASSVLAKATKSDAATITNYMGTMYGIFKKDADAMGNANWVNAIAGKTAYAVQMFKTTGNEMSGAFTALGASATSAGADVSEQFAVLGQLQATMSGSEAGTKYKSFLAGVGGAAKTLGLQFTDASGRMKSTPQILELIRGKYGDLSKVADSDLIKKAFGSDEAVAMIKLLINNTGQLKDNIVAIGSTNSLDKAVAMAKNMVDPWERLTAYMDAVRIVIGSTLLPTIYPLLNGVADTGKQFMRWQELFPHITKSIGLVVMAIIGATAAGAAVNLMLGAGQLSLLAFRAAWATVTLPVRIYTAALWVGNKAMLAFRATMTFIRGAMLAYSIATGAAGIATTSLLWPVLAVIAVIAGLGLAIYACWQPIKAFISGFIDGFIQAAGSLSPFAGVFSLIGRAISGVWNTVKALFGWFVNLISPIQSSAAELQGVTSAGVACGQFVAQAIGLILSPIQLVITWAGHLFDAIGIIKQGWLDVIAAFNLSSPIESFKNMGSAIGNMFSGLWQAIKASFSDTFNWIVSGLNKLPGIDIDLMQTAQAHPAVPASLAPDLLTGGTAQGVGRNGVQAAGAVSNGQTTIDQRKTFGNTTIQVQQMPTPALLREWQETQG